MAFRSILRVARPDHGPDDAEFVLVYIASGGRNDLDLKLLASENTAVFSTSCELQRNRHNSANHELVLSESNTHRSETEPYFEVESQKQQIYFGRMG